MRVTSAVTAVAAGLDKTNQLSAASQTRLATQGMDQLF